MKVFISADIEGTCGITDWAETERCTMDDYKPFQKQMTREVKAACKGALDAGVGEIFLKDAHDSARNIDAAELPECIRILRGWTGDPLSMMSGLDRDDYGAVLFTGYHAWASCPGNPLSHTNNLKNECQRAGFSLEVVCQCYDTPMAMQLVQAGFGVSYLPRSIVKTMPDSGIYTKPVQGLAARSYPVLVWTENIYYASCVKRYIAMAGGGKEKLPRSEEEKPLF